MNDRPRYLARTATGHSYTTSLKRAIRAEPEPVSDAWLGDFTSDARARHDAFTTRSACEHGIRVVLRHEGITDSQTVKARVSEVLDCDPRTVERAAAQMDDLVRHRGHRSRTTWSLTSDTTMPTSREALSPTALRHQIARCIWGDRQSPLATPQEIAAELLADELTNLMGATEHYEPEQPE